MTLEEQYSCIKDLSLGSLSITYLELDECLIHVSTVELLESHKIEESTVSVTSPLVAFRVISTKITTC